ncbi:hypothetical protein [Pseudonocardia sp. H11422]|nr:hypothetical protein [Pseudonocardia sp. H11422]
MYTVLQARGADTIVQATAFAADLGYWVVLVETAQTDGVLSVLT